MLYYGANVTPSWELRQNVKLSFYYFMSNYFNAAASKIINVLLYSQVCSFYIVSLNLQEATLIGY